MTRIEAIAAITKHLEGVDDATLTELAKRLDSGALPTMTVGDVLESMSAEHALQRQLSPRELELIEQSREDFRLGRTLTSEEMWGGLDDRLAAHGVPRSDL